MRLRFIANGNVRDDLPDDAAQLLISVGIAERLEDEDEDPEPDAEEPAPVNGRRRYRRRDLQPEP